MQILLVAGVTVYLTTDEAVRTRVYIIIAATAGDTVGHVGQQEPHLRVYFKLATSLTI